MAIFPMTFPAGKKSDRITQMVLMLLIRHLGLEGKVLYDVSYFFNTLSSIYHNIKGYHFLGKMQYHIIEKSLQVSPLIEETFRRITNRLPIVFSGLQGGGKAWLIATLADRLEAPLVVLTESFKNADQLFHDLELISGAGKAFFFPNWDTVPYDNFSPNKELVAQRFEALEALLEKRCRILVTTPQAMMQGMMPIEVFSGLSFRLESGGRYPRAELVKNLLSAGYVRVDLVEAPGEFSVRGEIVDIFSIQADHPVRLDFFDDDLEDLRFFEVGTQKSFQPVDSIKVYPANEGVINSDTVSRALSRLPDYKARVQPETYRQIYQYLEQCAPFPGADQLLELLFDNVGWLHQALDPDSLLLMDEPEILERRAGDYFNEVLGEYELSLTQGNLAPEPKTSFLPPVDFKKVLRKYYQAGMYSLRIEGGPETIAFPFANNLSLRSQASSDGQSAHKTLGRILENLKEWRNNGAPVILCSRSDTGAERLKNLLGDFELGARIVAGGPAKLGEITDKAESGQPVDFTILTRTPRQGFRLIDENGETRFAIITEEELLGEKTRQRRLKKSNIQHFIASLGDLKEGDLVVHLEYGIGCYGGLKKIKAGREEGDFLVISYAGDDKVYVPVYRLNQVQKYTSVEGAAFKLNKLGDGAWRRTKQKATRIIEDIAEELVKVQAARKAREGHSFEYLEGPMTEFEEAFPFQETEDQHQAIEEVLADLSSEMPTDRLVCGDVGFGKTEVALRAAYQVVLGDKQVMLLVPTTVLAQQHYETFRKRFEEFAVNIDVLSRFRTAQEQKKVVRAFGAGEIDILIGTHRILSKDVRPKDLGLLVIDEEQRFGVTHKERIKQMRTQVDVITLSATPIPRTLHMALMGVRDLSIINTPPMDRLAIRTRLVKAGDYIIREAVEREVRRGGQVFIVNNKVENIHAYGIYLQSIIPKVKLAIAHGQMAERELEEVMLRFVKGEIEVLLTTTIIESGLDIPKANTIIINNADKFGLSQLYQLRGRVGRSSLQAYAYLMVSPEKVLTEVAQKRLTLLQEFNDLGSGFKIASHDLEIRGAGNLLGREQSGHINSIGLELFTKMVEEAVAKFKGEDAAKPKPGECKLELGFPYLLPDSFIESTQQRLELYKQLAEIKTDEELWETKQVLEDRFGKVPVELNNLFSLILIRLKAGRFGLSALERVGGKLQAKFAQPERIDLDRLMPLLGKPGNQLQLLPEDKLLLGPFPETPEGVLECLHILEEIVPDEAA